MIHRFIYSLLLSHICMRTMFCVSIWLISIINAHAHAQCTATASVQVTVIVYTHCGLSGFHSTWLTICMRFSASNNFSNQCTPFHRLESYQLLFHNVYWNATTWTREQTSERTIKSYWQKGNAKIDKLTKRTHVEIYYHFRTSIGAANAFVPHILSDKKLWCYSLY